MHVIIPDVFLEAENLPTISEVFSPSFLLQEPGLSQEWQKIFENFSEPWKCLKVDEKEILLFQEKAHETLKLANIEDGNAEYIGGGAFGNVEKVRVEDIGHFAVKEVDLTPEDARILLQRETSQEVFASESAQSAQLETFGNLLSEGASGSLNPNFLGEISTIPSMRGQGKFLEIYDRLPDDEFLTSMANYCRDKVLAEDLVSDEFIKSLGALGNPTKINRSRFQYMQKEAKNLNNRDFLARYLTTFEHGASGAHNFPTSTWIKIDLGPPITVSLSLLSPFYPFTLEDYMKQKCVTQVPKDNFMRTVIAESMLQLLWQVSAMHRMNYIHRDIKPSNIFGDPFMPNLNYVSSMSKTAEEQQVRLLESPATDEVDLDKIAVFYPHLGDFSVAHILPPEGQKEEEEEEDMVARSFIPSGTQYVAPELLDGARCSKASDMYALGVIFFELLAGKPYHEEDARNADFEKLCKEEERVVSQMLEPNPSKRIQAPECCELIEELLSELNGPEYHIKRADDQEKAGQKVQNLVRYGKKAIVENLRKKSFDDFMEWLRIIKPEEASEMEDMWKEIYGDDPVPEDVKEVAKDAYLENLEEVLSLQPDEERKGTHDIEGT